MIQKAVKGTYLANYAYYGVGGFKSNGCKPMVYRSILEGSHPSHTSSTTCMVNVKPNMKTYILGSNDAITNVILVRTIY